MIVNIFLGLVDIYVTIIIVYVLMSWLPSMSGFIRDVYEALGILCDPYLNIFKRIIPPVGGSGMRIDFSPIIAIIVLQMIARLIARLL